MLRRKFGLLLISVVCLALILIDCGSGSDAAPIPPALTILKSHVGNFPRVRLARSIRFKS